MTIEETKERIAVMQAYVDGKQIQMQLPDGKWAEIPNPDWCTNANYRVKPEPKYRPFKNADECWQEMLKHQPFGWVKEKTKSSYENLACITKSSEYPISFAGYGSEDMGGMVVRPAHSFDRMFKFFTFADGTPLGVKEGA
jgi:hypothetical protein